MEVVHLKKKKKKNSYMDEFLKRRQQAVDFAIQRKNKSGYDYSKPFYFLNDNESILNKNKEREIKNKKNKNHKISNHLNFDFIGEAPSKNNNYIIKKESKDNKNKNNKNKNNKNFEQAKSEDEELIDFLMSNVEMIEKNQDNPNYSINISSEKNIVVDNKENENEIIIHNKTEQNDKKIINKNPNNNNNENRGFGKNLIIERINETNYCLNYYKEKEKETGKKEEKENEQEKEKEKEKEHNEIAKKNFLTPLDINNNNKDFYYLKKNIENENNNPNFDVLSEDNRRAIRRENRNIYYINNNNDKMHYYEGEENHRFYDSSGVKDYSYNYESYKIKKYIRKKNDQNYPKNYSESKLMKQKNVYISKNNKKKKLMSPIKNVIKNIEQMDNSSNCQTNENEIDIHNENGNQFIKSYCSCDNRHINILDSGTKDSKSNEGINNLKQNVGINNSKKAKIVSITFNSGKKKEIKTENKDKKGNEIIEIINEDKNIINNNHINYHKEKREKEKTKIIFLQNIKKHNGNNKLNELDNYYLIKQKNDSFLKQKEDEKEPNIQSIIECDYELSLNDDSVNKYNNQCNIVNNIRDTIKLIKKNSTKNKENINYINEIDNYYKKIKEKEKNNNKIILNEYQKNNVKIKRNEDNKDGHKILIEQKTQRVNSMIKNIFDNQNKSTKINFNQVQYVNTNPSSIKNILKMKENGMKKNKKEYKINRNKSSKEFNVLNDTNINLIVEQNGREKIKIIDEKELEDFKNRNIKTSRGYQDITSKLRDINKKRLGYKKNLFLNNKLNQLLFNNKLKKINGDDNELLLSSRSIWFYLENKIMTPNEI